MTLKIGRVEFECGPNSGSQVYRSRQWVLVAEIAPGSLSEAQTIRQQLLGMAESTDPFPVTWSDDASVQGAYRFETPESCVVSPISNYLLHGMLSVSLQLSLVARGAQTLETYMTGVVRPNVYALAETGTAKIRPHPRPIWGNEIPSSKVGYGGIRSWYIRSAGTSAPDETFVFRCGVLPDEYYDGGAVLEVWSNDDTSWAVHEGMQAPHDAAGWRLSNGLIRCFVDDGDFVVERVIEGGASWGNEFRFDMGEPVTASEMVGVGWVTVVRNSWGSAAVRFFVYGSSSGGGGFVTVRLDAASEFAQVYFDVSNGDGMQLDRPSAGTQIAAAYGGSQSASSADSNSHSWFLVTSRSSTVTTSVEVDKYGVGVGVTGPESWSSDSDSAAEFLYAQDVHHTVVSL